MQFGSTVKTIHYDGDRLHETIQVGDSTPRVLDRTFPMTVSDSISSSSYCSHFRCAQAFARFSHSTPRATTRSSSIPRRSCSSHKRLTTPHASSWTVRFADPAIVSTYVIDTLSRRITSYDIQARKSGMHSWIRAVTLFARLLKRDRSRGCPAHFGYAKSHGRRISTAA